MFPLDDAQIRDLLRQAWHESVPGTADAHEERGFVLRHADGSLGVERWPKGIQNEITVPPHPGGRRGIDVIVLTFHTHPNLGADFQQEPSLTDIRAVSGDPHLGHFEYEGEIVISGEYTYLIRRNGDVEVLGLTKDVLKIA